MVGEEFRREKVSPICPIGRGEGVRDEKGGGGGEGGGMIGLGVEAEHSSSYFITPLQGFTFLAKTKLFANPQKLYNTKICQK